MTEPVACCLNGFEQINFKPNCDVVIFGAGPIGQIIAKLSVYFKSNKFLIDNKKNKLRQGITDKKIQKLSYSQLKKLRTKKIKFLFVACSSIDAQSQAIKFAENN